MDHASMPAAANVPVLEVSGLKTLFFTRQGVVTAVNDVSFSVGRGETLAVVGESGCGKSMTALSIMRLIPNPPGRIVAGEVRLDGRELLALSETEMRDVRGNDISMIFQEPMTSLNPVMTIGNQIAEAVRLLIADEPTTALDVTIQAQILDLMVGLQKELGTAILLITHDLGVVAETAQRVIVMYAGRKVEEADVDTLFAQPLHPYTHGLMASVPHLAVMTGDTSTAVERLQEIPGSVPPLTNLPPGCVFAPRCAHAEAQCRAEYPPYEERAPGHWAACWHADRLAGAAA